MRSKTRFAGPGELRNAIDAYTSHAAYASYDEHRKGTLARGMLADIVILSNDIFELASGCASRDRRDRHYLRRQDRVSAAASCQLQRLICAAAPRPAETLMATKITYATLGGDSLEDLHRELDAAIAAAPQTFGREHLLYINGKHLKADAQFDDRSPIDTGIALGTFQKGTREHVKSAVAAARAAYPAWAALSWQERLSYVRRIAEAIRTHRYHLSALMGYEVGKNRLECVGDVEEGADLMAYYCDQIEHHNGFVEKMGTLGPGEDNVSVLRPYGVWAVISPFNFPLALAAGPAGGALASGNTVVFKPASDTPVDGREAHRDGRRGRPAAWRVQLRDRTGIDRGPGAHRQRRHRRHRLYRLEGSRAEADARQRGARGAAAR